MTDARYAKRVKMQALFDISGPKEQPDKILDAFGFKCMSLQ
jgi:hypothetical protein